MISELSVVPAAMTAFAITNADDIIVLSLFFTGRSRRDILRIIVGQYLGFSALLLLSVAIGVAGAAIATRWIGLLGLLPIYLGVRGYLSAWRTRDNKVNTVTAVEERAAMQIASVTVANGADNLAVYGSIFAASSWRRVFVISGVFYAMVAVWCLLGWAALKHPALSERIAKRAHAIIPGALILIGVAIVASAFRQ